MHNCVYMQDFQLFCFAGQRTAHTLNQTNHSSNHQDVPWCVSIARRNRKIRPIYRTARNKSISFNNTTNFENKCLFEDHFKSEQRKKMCSELENQIWHFRKWFLASNDVCSDADVLCRASTLQKSDVFNIQKFKFENSIFFEYPKKWRHVI